MKLITPSELNTVSGHLFHGYIFADGLCFSMTELSPGQWHVGNGIRGHNVSTLTAALAAFIKMMTDYGLDVRGTKNLWALAIARAFKGKAKRSGKDMDQEFEFYQKRRLSRNK